MAVLNLRFLDAGVAKVQTEGETSKKAVRRAMGTKSVTRLAAITVIAIGLMLLNGGLGIGAVVGLVIFQLFFVLNVGRVSFARASNEPQSTCWPAATSPSAITGAWCTLGD